MHMISIRRAFAGIAAGLLTLAFTPAPGADAATTAPHPLMASHCPTGQQGTGDRKGLCLTNGTPRDAARLWSAFPQGAKGHEHDDTDQRGICRYAYRHGGIAAAVTDLTTDESYDHYANWSEVTTWAGQLATLTCAQDGYHI
jgi:hypothetical protein